jgi:hypothetical protein
MPFQNGIGLGVADWSPLVEDAIEY